MPAAAPDPASAITEEFPHWLTWVTGTGRWWASRKDTLSAADRAAFLHADDPGALAAQIRAQETAPGTVRP